MLTGDGKTFTYSSFDKPKTIVKGAAKTEFLYGPSLGRYKRTDTVTGETGSGTQNTWYLDGIYEKVEDKNGKIIERFFLGDFGIIERTESAVAGLYLEQTRYFLKDHIGSVLAIVEGGSMRLLQQFHYDVWGKREYVKTGLGMNPWDSFGLSGRLGFTGHEMLDTVGLIHMNGRVYDPELARFVSADPIIQSAYETQSYNRYSYVWNNPLSKTDPSGFKMVDAEHTNRARDNNESNSRYDRRSDRRNNRDVRNWNLEKARAAAKAKAAAGIAAAAKARAARVAKAAKDKADADAAASAASAASVASAASAKKKSWFNPSSWFSGLTKKEKTMISAGIGGAVSGFIGGFVKGFIGGGILGVGAFGSGMAVGLGSAVTGGVIAAMAAGATDNLGTGSGALGGVASEVISSGRINVATTLTSSLSGALGEAKGSLSSPAAKVTAAMAAGAVGGYFAGPVGKVAGATGAGVAATLDVYLEDK